MWISNCSSIGNVMEILWISLLNTNPDQQPTIEGSNAWMISFRIWGFPKIGVPPNHRIFHEINQLFWIPPFHLVVSQSLAQCSPQRWCESWTNRSIRSQSSTYHFRVCLFFARKFLEIRGNSLPWCRLRYRKPTIYRWFVSPEIMGLRIVLLIYWRYWRFWSTFSVGDILIQITWRSWEFIPQDWMCFLVLIQFQVILLNEYEVPALLDVGEFV